MLDKICKIEVLVSLIALLAVSGSFLIVFQSFLLKGVSTMLDSKFLSFKETLEKNNTDFKTDFKTEFAKDFTKDFAELVENQRSLLKTTKNSDKVINEKYDDLMDFLLEKFPKK